MTLRIVTPIRIQKDCTTLYLYFNYYEMLQKYHMDLIVTTPSQKTTYQALVKQSDGLLLSGGYDVDPTYYGQACHPKTVIEPAAFEEMEFTSIDLFTKAKKAYFRNLSRHSNAQCILSWYTMARHP